MQQPRTCLRQWPLFRRAPLMTCGRIHRSIVDRRFALPAVVDILQVPIEEPQQLDWHWKVSDLTMLPGAHPQLARIVQIVEGKHGFEAAFIEPVAPDEYCDFRFLDLLSVRCDACLAPERHT